MKYISKLIVFCLMFMFSVVIHITAQDVHQSYNNSTGNWEDIGTWFIGDGDVRNDDTVKIYGFVSSNSALTINNGAVLNVYDTLIIYGNFTVGQSGILNIHAGGMLIVYGNATMSNSVQVDLDSYFVVMGDYSQKNSADVDAPADDTLLYVTGGTSCNESQSVCVSADLVGDEDDLLDNPDLEDIIEATSSKIIPLTPTFCTGGSVVLSIRSDGNNYQWFETSATGTILSTTSTLVVSAAGEYDVTFAIGGSGQNPDPVTASSSGTASHSISGVVVDASAAGASDGSITLTVNGATSPTYDWSNGETTQNISGLIAGDYTVEVDDGGCVVAETFTVEENVCTDPSLSTVTTPVICVGGSYDLSNVVVVDANSTNPTYTYHNATPASAGNELASTLISPVSTTNYYILGTNGTCTDELVVSVTVNSLPVIAISATPATICYGETSVLSASAPGAVSFAWTPNGELTNAGTATATYTPAANPTNNPPQVTTTFVVTVTDANTCVNTNTVDVILNRLSETGPQYHIENTWGN